MHEIKIGTMVRSNENPVDYIKQILPYGFECFSIMFWQTTHNIDLKKLAQEIKEVLKGTNAFISNLSIFGNPLETDKLDLETLKAWQDLIDHAHLFGTDLVTGFTGRVRGTSIDHSITRFTEIWTPLAKRAQDKQIRIAFENCDMNGTWLTGDWNIAHNPNAWTLMFEALPFDNVGLQWEPCHQMVSLIDPLPQLKEWMPKVFAIHGKDASIDWDLIKKQGIHGPEQFVHHRTPGFGDTNWTDLITILRKAAFKGTIDIEGWHDPVYKNELEMTGQVHALNYLKQCRGGPFIANPKI